MQDVMATNPMSITGTPTLVSSPLTVDPNQALQFDGSTNSGSVTDSPSLSITSSMSMEFFLRFPTAPGSTKDLVAKSASYAMQLNSSRKLLWVVTNGASSVTVTSNATLATDTWYHVVGVYNGGYTGAQQFGKTTTGSTTAVVEDDASNNKAVSKFTLAETALLTAVNLSLEYTDEVWSVNMRAVVYSDSGGAPDKLVSISPISLLYQPFPQWRAWTWIPFAISPALVPAGNYHIGYVSDTICGIQKSALAIGRETSGGTTSRRNDSVSSPSDPFGSVTSSNADVLAAYCDYTAVGRTGFEGKAAIYINGVLDNSSAYTAGIADNANALSICPSFAASIDELSIWNRALSGVEIASHYTAH